MASCNLILMPNVTSSDGLMLVSTDDKIDQLRRPNSYFILMTSVTSSDGLMSFSTDDTFDKFRWPHDSYCW